MGNQDGHEPPAPDLTPSRLEEPEPRDNTPHTTRSSSFWSLLPVVDLHSAQPFRLITPEKGLGPWAILQYGTVLKVMCTTASTQYTYTLHTSSQAHPVLLFAAAWREGEGSEKPHLLSRTAPQQSTDLVKESDLGANKGTRTAVNKAPGKDQQDLVSVACRRCYSGMLFLSLAHNVL